MSSSPDISASSSRAPAFAFALLAAVWLILVIASPYLVSHFDARDLLFKAGALVFLAGRAICHQRADRSFHAWGVQLPVCARCFGIYAGATLGALLGSGLRVPHRTQRALSDLTPGGRTFFAVAAGPTVLSVGLEALGIWSQTPLVRCIAGLPLGVGVAWFVAAHAATAWSRVQNRPGV